MNMIDHYLADVRRHRELGPEVAHLEEVPSKPPAWAVVEAVLLERENVDDYLDEAGKLCVRARLSKEKVIKRVPEGL